MGASNQSPSLALRRREQEPGPTMPASMDVFSWAPRESHQTGEWEERFGISQSPWVPSNVSGSRLTPWKLQDLRGYHPTKLEFTLPHAASERADAWFQETFRHLYRKTLDFSVLRFGRRDFPEISTRSPWVEANLSTQFLDYASQISRQDPLVGGWDMLLTNKAHRAFLVAGILSKVLVNCVFSSLLFGATAEKEKLLEAHDLATISDDGYKRTNRRAQMVRDALQDDILTQEFWPRVDELATQTLSLMLPLINFLGQKAPMEKWPGLIVVYQELHDIIAEAAYFSICIRLSRTILKIEYPDPGDIWDLDYEQLGGDIYQKSKKSAEDHDYLATEKSRAESQDGAGQNTQGYRPARMAKVKVVAWPLIKRFKPLGSVEDYGALDGERVALISRSAVVYYYGMSDDQGEMRERKPTLAEHMAKHTGRPKMWTQRTNPIIFPFIIPVVLTLSALLFVALHKAGVLPSNHGAILHRETERLLTRAGLSRGFQVSTSQARSG